MRAKVRAQLSCLCRCFGLVDGTPAGETGTVPQQLRDQDLAGSEEQEEQEQVEGPAPPRRRKLRG